MTLNRKIANLIKTDGQTKLSVLTNADQLDSAEVTAIVDTKKLTYLQTLDSLPVSGLTSGQRAFVESNQRLYISNGSGWYNTGFVNLSPRWDSTPLGSLDSTSIVDSATDLIIVAKAVDSDNSDLNLINQSFASDSAQYLVNISNDSSVWTFDPKSDDSISASVTAGDLTDSDNNSFVYTFKWSDGISFISKAITINYNFERVANYTGLRGPASRYAIGSTDMTFDGTKVEGSHAAYITGAGSINHYPGYGQSQATVESYSAYTIAMFVRVSRFNPTYNVFYAWNTNDKSSAGNSYGSCALSLHSTGWIEFCTEKYTSGGYSGITSDVGTLSTDTWYHVVATASTFPSSEVALWVSERGSTFGGILSATSFSNNATRLFTRSNATNLTIGKAVTNQWYLHGSQGNAANDADGLFDDVRIYFGKASSSDAQAIFEADGDVTLSSNPMQSGLRYRYGFNNTYNNLD